MQILTKNIRWRALMETYQTAKFDCSPNNLSRDIVLSDQWPEQKKKKKGGKERIRKAKTLDLHLYAGLNMSFPVIQYLPDPSGLILYCLISV